MGGGNVRRLVVVLSAVIAAVFMVSSVALSVELGPDDQQYQETDGSEASVGAQEDDAQERDTSSSGFVSQGSGGTGDSPEALAAQRDLAEEASKPYYSQVVDNSTKGRFVAPGWEKVSGAGNSYKDSHVVAPAGSDARDASFRMKVPADDDYAVYAWWSAAESNASVARFVIPSASGPQTEEVDQTKEGGMWIRLGTFDMKKGERTIEVSPSDDADVVADAVIIVRDEQAPLPEYTMASTEGGDTMRTLATRSSANGRDIVRVARRYLGTRYRYATCTSSRMSCTCETKLAVKPFGHRFPMTEKGQWRYEPSRKIRGKSNLRPGDIVFFREGGSRITHVGVYSGRGYLVHASSYFGKVVESKMRYIRGFTGAIRVNPR